MLATESVRRIIDSQFSSDADGRMVAADGRGDGERGFIIIAVLWILTALAVLAVIYSIFVINTVTFIAGGTDRVRNEAAISAAIELTCYQLLSVDEKVRPTSGRFNGQIGLEKLSVDYVSEAARIDLNLASKEFLAGLMIGLGEDVERAYDEADRIVAWRKPMRVANADDDPENSLYQNSGLNYLPRHGPFPHADELRLVYGMSGPLVERMLPFVTVFNGRASINILEAAPQVVAALPHMTPEKLQNILSARASDQPDPQSLIALSGFGDDLVTIEGSRAVRMAIRVDFGNGRQVATEAVVLLLKDGIEPFRLLSRRDNIDHDDAGGASNRKKI
jgi:general secretion pathway protein K